MQKRSNTGFTLVEVIIALLIVSILTAIALPAYGKYVTKARRAAAEACLTIHASYMERFYATNMRYDQTPAGVAMDDAALAALALQCASNSDTGAFYRYTITTSNAPAGYVLSATPKGSQLKNDKKCGVLTLNQNGVRTEAGTGSLSDCWAH